MSHVSYTSELSQNLETEEEHANTSNYPIIPHPIFSEQDIERRLVSLDVVEKKCQLNLSLMGEMITRIDWNSIGIRFDNVFQQVHQSIERANNELSDFVNLMITLVYLPRFETNVNLLEELMNFQNPYNIEKQCFTINNVEIPLDVMFIRKIDEILKKLQDDGNQIIKKFVYKQGEIGKIFKELCSRRLFFKLLQERSEPTTAYEKLLYEYYQTKMKLDNFRTDFNPLEELINLSASFDSLHRNLRQQKQLAVIKQNINIWKHTLKNVVELTNEQKLGLFNNLRTRFEKAERFILASYNLIRQTCKYFTASVTDREPNVFEITHLGSQVVKNEEPPIKKNNRDVEVQSTNPPMTRSQSMP